MRGLVRILIVAMGLFLPLVLSTIPSPTRGASPDIVIGISVDAATADPEDLLTYTVFLDNRGPDEPASLWVNDTVPTGTAYVDDTAATDIGSPVFLGRSFAGNTVRLQFSTFPLANLSFQVRARVGLGVADRQVLQNVALLWYSDPSGVGQPMRSAAVSTAVAIPVVSVAKTGTFTAVDAIRYVITITNSGTASARNLWWNDTLPSGVVYSRIQPLGGAACSHSGPMVNCTMSNAFAPGSRTWNLDVTIPAPLPPGRVLTNWLFVNYTDSDRTHLGEVRTSAPLTVATANIHVFKIADATRVAPGGTIAYTIFYNNTGQFAARRVWINDTLPTAAVEVVSVTPAPDVQSQSAVKWQFTDLLTGAYFVTVVVRALPSLGDGTILTNAVTLNYTDTNGIAMPGSVGAAATTVSADIPAIAAEIVANRVRVEPGGTIGYTLYYNNTRPALASSVVVDLLLPRGLSLLSANPLHSWIWEGKFIWNLTDVRTGEHWISLVVGVPTDAAVGTVLRATAFANYTDGLGNRVGGSQTSAVVTVDVSAPPAALRYEAVLIALVVGALVAIIAGRLYLARVGETVVDEVFLLHRDGLLIKHYTRRLRPDVDSDVLSGMLIAVQNFVNESFIGDAGLKREGMLDEMKFGAYRILIVRGEYVIAAAVVSGARVERIPGQIRAAIGDMEGKLGGALATWDGNMDEVAAADPIMRDLIAGRYANSRKFGRGKH